MPSERVSDGILFDGDISAAVCPYVVIWRSFCRVLSDFTAVTVWKAEPGDLSSIRRQWWVVWSSIGIRRYFECRLFSEESPNV